MSVREIPVSEWQEFLEQFSRERRAWLASVDRTEPHTPPHVEMAERPLASVTPEMAGPRIVGIRITFQPDSQAGDAVEIEAPTKIRIDENDERAARALEIEDEHGGCTRLRFRVTALPEMLDGLAPAELIHEPGT